MPADWLSPQNSPNPRTPCRFGPGSVLLASELGTGHSRHYEELGRSPKFLSTCAPHHGVGPRQVPRSFARFCERVFCPRAGKGAEAMLGGLPGATGGAPEQPERR